MPAAAAPLSLGEEGLQDGSSPRGLNKSVYSGPLIGSALAITSPVAALLPHPTGPSPAQLPPCSRFLFPQLRQSDFSHAARGNQNPITALRQEKHRHKHKAAFGKTAIACSGFALKRERAELKMCQEQPGWHCFIFTKKSLLIAH